MPRITPRLVGDAIQILASVGMLAGLVMLIVEAVGTREPSTGTGSAGSPAAHPSAGAPVAVSAARQEELEAFVRQNCTLCHGSEGSLAPFLTPANLEHLSENAISLTILHGRLKGMPAWDYQLSEADARWIAGYLKQGGFVR
jgi:mono/diheme cytochrome c family protein